jgi:hypothetical protein
MLRVIKQSNGTMRAELRPQGSLPLVRAQRKYRAVGATLYNCSFHTKRAWKEQLPKKEIREINTIDLY